MSRYQVARDEEERDSLWPWVVIDTDLNSGSWELGPTFTEAEANICAFALNAIANGHSLLAVTGGQIKDWQAYEGPTGGVASNG